MPKSADKYLEGGVYSPAHVGGFDCNLETISKQLAAATSQFDLFRFLREVAARYDFKYFAVNSVPTVTTTSIAETMIITSAPSELIRRYDEYSLIASSPASKQMRKAGAPFERRLGISLAEPDDIRQTMLSDLLVEFDLDCWFFVPVSAPETGAAVVSFLGKRERLGFRETAELALLSSLVHERLRIVSVDDRPVTCSLSVRERECLVWSAIGKTSFEIGKILELSEHTINHYLNSATKKTGAVNRTQAVAFAIRSGWID